MKPISPLHGMDYPPKITQVIEQINFTSVSAQYLLACISLSSLRAEVSYFLPVLEKVKQEGYRQETSARRSGINLDTRAICTKYENKAKVFPLKSVECPISLSVQTAGMEIMTFCTPVRAYRRLAGYAVFLINIYHF